MDPMTPSTRRDAIAAAARNGGPVDETPAVCQRPGCIRDSAAVVEIHDRLDGTILRRHLCAEDRNQLVALFGRRHV